MEIRRTNLEGMQVSQPTKQDVEQESISIQDKCSFTQADLSADGKLTLIIQPKDRNSTGILREKCDKSGIGRCKDDLSIIDAFTYEVDPSDLPKLLEMISEDVEITVDHQMKFFSPEQIPRD